MNHLSWIYKNLIISSLLAFGVFLFIYYSETGLYPSFENNWLDILLSVFLVNIFGAGMYFLNKFYNKTIPWNRNRSTRFLLEFCSGIIILSLLAGIFVYAYLEPMIITDPENIFWEQYSDGAIKCGILAIVITYLYSLINFSIFSYNQYSYMQIETIRVERDQLNLQFEALKSQLSPHFLFNALNTISSLIYRDIKQSDKFIRRLASTYSYILKTDDKKLVRFSRELEMTKSYFYMQKIRYGDFFNFEINLDAKTLDSYIPPLTLQMLAENALKHNMVGEDTSLVIHFSQNSSDQIIVSNNIVKKPELVKIGNNLLDRPKSDGSHKMGLQNIRNRYGYFTNRKIEIEIDKNFTVKLPIIYQNLEKQTVL